MKKEIDERRMTMIFLCVFLALLMLGAPVCTADAASAAGIHIVKDIVKGGKPRHSELYIPGVSVEDIIVYFNEVCLDSEITNSGNPTVVQKWTAPIRYELHGNYTAKDVEVVEGLCAWLNTVHGFPGIYESEYSAQTTMDIYFCSKSEIKQRMGEQYVNVDGAVTFWYERNEIYNAIICCRDDMGQYLRNSVIMEEIYNGLGPVQDTRLRPDSLIYQYYAEPQQLSAVDEVIIRLLYHPDIKCGMNAQQCEEVIRSLYY
jgi:hypothetical protein